MPGDEAKDAVVEVGRTTEVVEKIKMTASYERNIVNVAVS